MALSSEQKRLFTLLTQEDSIAPHMSNKGFVYLDVIWEHFFYFNPQKIYDDRYFTFEQDDKGRISVCANYGHVNAIADRLLETGWFFPLEDSVEKLYITCVNDLSIGVLNSGRRFNTLSIEKPVNQGFLVEFNVIKLKKLGFRFWRLHGEKNVYCFEPLNHYSAYRVIEITKEITDKFTHHLVVDLEDEEDPLVEDPLVSGLEALCVC